MTKNPTSNEIPEPDEHDPVAMGERVTVAYAEALNEIAALRAEVDLARREVEKSAAFRIAAETRADRLAAVIRNAPHGRGCPAAGPAARRAGDCDCWKASALAAEEKP